jgi:hypothetical protein
LEIFATKLASMGVEKDNLTPKQEKYLSYNGGNKHCRCWSGRLDFVLPFFRLTSGLKSPSSTSFSKTLTIATASHKKVFSERRQKEALIVAILFK